MELNREETRRDYVFGRLISLMREATDVIDPTTGQYCSVLEGFDDHPVSTYERWFEQYMRTLKSFPEIAQEMRDILDRFKTEDFNNKRITDNGYYTMGMYDEVKWLREGILNKYLPEEMK